MLQNNKIRLMTRLAIYDKKYGTLDRKKRNFFRWDYIYFRNFKIRAGVLCGCLILLFFYAVKLFAIDQVDFLSMDIKTEATRVIVAIIAILAVYTLIGTIVAFREYSTSRNRLDTYFAMLDKLDELNGRPKKPEDGQHRENHFEKLEKLEDVNLSDFDPKPGDSAAPEKFSRTKAKAASTPAEPEKTKLPKGIELLKKKDIIGTKTSPPASETKKPDDELVATSQSAAVIMSQKTKPFDKRDILTINDSAKPKKAAATLAEKTKYNTLPPTPAEAKKPEKPFEAAKDLKPPEAPKPVKEAQKIESAETDKPANVRITAYKKKRAYLPKVAIPTATPEVIPPGIPKGDEDTGSTSAADAMNTANESAKVFRASDSTAQRTEASSYGIRSAFDDYSNEINEYIDNNENKMKGGKK